MAPFFELASSGHLAHLQYPTPLPILMLALFYFGYTDIILNLPFCLKILFASNGDAKTPPAVAVNPNSDNISKWCFSYWCWNLRISNAPLEYWPWLLIFTTSKFAHIFHSALGPALLPLILDITFGYLQHRWYRISKSRKHHLMIHYPILWPLHSFQYWIWLVNTLSLSLRLEKLFGIFTILISIPWNRLGLV